MWLSGLSACLGSKRSGVPFPVRAQAWVAGQVSQLGVHERQQIDLSLTPDVFLPLFLPPPSLPLSLKNK